MDKAEAGEILARQMERLERLSFQELLAYLDQDGEHLLVSGRSGVEYQVEILVFWDDKEKRNLRVMVCIDDGGLRAFFPLTASFLVAAPAGWQE